MLVTQSQWCSSTLALPTRVGTPWHVVCFALLSVCFAGCISFYDVGAPVVLSDDAADVQQLDGEQDSGGLDVDATDTTDTPDTTDTTPVVILARPHQDPNLWVLVGPGEYVMGSPLEELGRDEDEEEATVTISVTLSVMRWEVTQSLWSNVFGVSPVAGCGDCPITAVSWFAGPAYANALSRRAGLEECYDLRGCERDEALEDPIECYANVRFEGVECLGYRLPTEAEWEFFARAGETGANFSGDAGACDAGSASPVGQGAANAWGVFDVLGNAEEWVYDTYDDYGNRDSPDPVRYRNNRDYVFRGGSYASAGACRLADRGAADGTALSPARGFRLVRTVASP